MAEPRARAARHKGQMNFASDCAYLLTQPLNHNTELTFRLKYELSYPATETAMPIPTALQAPYPKQSAS